MREWVAWRMACACWLGDERCKRLRLYTIMNLRDYIDLYPYFLQQRVFDRCVDFVSEIDT